MGVVNMGHPRICIGVIFLVTLLLAGVSVGTGAQVDFLDEGERNDDPESATVLQNGDAVRGSIVKDDRDFFSFFAPSGTVVKIGVAPLFESRLAIFDSDMNPVDWRSNGDFLILEVPTGGEYFFGFRYAPDVDDDLEDSPKYTGEYRFILEIGDGVEPTDENELNDEKTDATHIPPSGRLHGVLEPGDNDWYTFHATRGEEIKIFAIHGPYPDWWYLEDEDGNTVEMDFTDSTMTATAPTTGQYYLSYQYNGQWLENQSDPSRLTGVFGEYYLLFDFDADPVQ